jgi:hypothetical protein
VSSSSGELMINRLLVLVQIILIPVYFLYFNIIWLDDIKEFFDQDSFLIDLLPKWLIWFETYLAIPIFFSLPWVLFSIIRATKIADTYGLMGRALGKVRIDQKLFYGINASFMLVFFIFPFASPIITILGIFIIFRIVSHKMLFGKISKLLWFIPALIVSLFPGILAYVFYSNYSVMFESVFDIWGDSVQTQFYVGLCLAIGITLGNFLTFLFERNARNTRSKMNPFRLVYAIKFILFGAMLFILFYVDNEDREILNAINIVAGIFAFSELIFRRLSKLPSDSSGANFMVFAFILINFVANRFRGSPDVFRGIMIVISGLIFFALFLISYKYSDDEELLARN